MIIVNNPTDVGIEDGAVTTAKIADANVTPAKLSQPFSRGTSVATTSGTFVDFTGIPSWVKRITVMFNGVSTNGASFYLIQVGAGSITNTGYTGGYNFYSQASSSGGGTLSAGFVTASNTAAALSYGSYVLYNITGNTWVCSSNVYSSGGPYITNCNGIIALGGVLDRVRLTTVNGTDTFDAGAVNINWE